MDEIWRDVIGYEGLYEISSLGRVKRVGRDLIDSNGKHKRISEMMMKQGHLNEVILHKDDHYSNKLVRALVGQAFLGVQYGEAISHINRDISDASLGNLMRTAEFRQLDPNWKDIPGYEGEYQASRFGEIRSVDRYVTTKNGNLRYCPGVVRVLDEDEWGYYQIALYRDGKCHKTSHAHIFVAKAWIPNPENKPTVNHIDGNKHNNCIENLEWATYSEQQAHATRTGLRKKSYWDVSIHGPVGGDWNENRQIKVRCIETGVEYPSMSAAGEAVGTSASEVKLSVDNHKMCQGLHFVRADELDYEFGVKSLEGEIWKDIPGYEGRYKMSSKKRVKSVERSVSSNKNGIQRTVPEKLLSLNYGLYLIDSNGKSKSYKLDEVYHSIFGNTKAKKLFNIG